MSQLSDALGKAPARRVSRVEERRRPWPNGMWGMALLLATETALFGLLVASYFYLRLNAASWPPVGVEKPRVLVPLVLLGLLVATSVPVQAASSAARRGSRRAALAALAVALVLQAGYLATQIWLFRDDLRDLSPRQSAYGSAYFTLLGAHHAHVAVGLLLELFLLLRLSTGLTVYRATGVRATALYWHVVNALAVIVTLTVLSPSL